MDVVVLVMLVVVDETVVVVMVIVVMVVVVMVVGSAVVVVVVLAAVDVVVCDVNLTIKSTTSTFIKCNDLALGECHALSGTITRSTQRVAMQQLHVPMRSRRSTPMSFQGCRRATRLLPMQQRTVTLQALTTSSRAARAPLVQI